MPKTYSELLKDPRWQKLRLEVMQRDEFTCMDCSNNEETLNVHHMYYMKGRNPWEYPKSRLVTLCNTCHNERTRHIEQIKSIIGSWNGDFLRDLSDLLKSKNFSPMHIHTLKLIADTKNLLNSLDDMHRKIYINGKNGERIGI